MNERQLHFRVGLFIILSLAVGVGMFSQFGELKAFVNRTYTVEVHFASAPGVNVSTPVTMYGLRIGEVQSIELDTKLGGVKVMLAIDEKYPLTKGVGVEIVSNLLGSSSLSLVPGQSLDELPADAVLIGKSAENPLEVVKRLEGRVATSLESLVATSDEWRLVGQNVNSLLSTNQESVQLVMQRSVRSLDDFSATMRKASTTLDQASTSLASINGFLERSDYEEHLTATMQALPKLVTETRDTIAATKATMSRVDENLASLKMVTGPLAARSQKLAVSLESTLGNIETMTTNLNTFTALLTKRGGTLHEFVSNPELYRNLNATAMGTTVLLKNLQPILRDVAIFSDKIARHPELLGVGGAMRGSSGLKTVTPASFQQKR